MNDNYLLLLEIARKKKQLGLLDEAIIYYQEALNKCCSKSEIIWYELGCVYYKAKKYDQAAYAFNKALEINDKDYITWYALGITYKRLKLWNQAVECFKQSIELNSKYWPAYASLLRTYLRLRQWKEAWHWFKKSLKELKET